MVREEIFTGGRGTETEEATEGRVHHGVHIPDLLGRPSYSGARTYVGPNPVLLGKML